MSLARALRVLLVAGLALVGRGPALAGPAAGAAGGPTIVDWPIAYGAERERLAIAYRRLHEDPAADDVAIEPRMIVVHHTGGSSARGTKRYFDRTRLEASRQALRKGGAVNVSAHFLIDRDGTIYRLVPETRHARHTIGLNHVAIGIENVGDGARFPLTDAQLVANAALIRDLAARFPITHLIGHHESRAMEGHAYWRERVRGYRNRKPDPGAAFMARLRGELTDLALDGPPQGEAAGGDSGAASRPHSR